MIIQKRLPWYGKRFFILPAAVILISTRCDAPFIVRFAYRQFSYGANPIPCPPSHPGHPKFWATWVTS